MTLPDFLQPENPLRPWAIAAGACALAALPPKTRRLGTTLVFLVVAMGAVFFFLNYAYRTFTP